MADQAPLGVFEFAERSRFAFKLLHSVLAKNAQSGGVGFCDPPRFHGLADGHERNLGFISAAALASMEYPFVNLSHCFLKHEASLTVDGKKHFREEKYENQNTSTTITTKINNILNCKLM